MGQKQIKAQQKAAKQQRRRRKKLIKKGLVWGGIGLIAAGALGWLGYSIATAKQLPPISIDNYSEELPPGHILNVPMPPEIQKHMLEHADGGGRPGVVINYNCIKFNCPDGMIDQLTEVARGYPAFVYLAPYPDMDVMTAVTKWGKILVLDEVDEARIRAFIERRR